jgi:fatty-acyl-CoA synthase
MENTDHTISRALAHVAAQNPHGQALVHTQAGRELTYSELSREVDEAARGLLSIGIRRGEKAALWAPNVPEWIVAFLALSRIGAVTVPLDPAADQSQLDYILRQSESRLLIVCDEQDAAGCVAMARRAQAASPFLREIVAVSAARLQADFTWQDLAARGRQVSAQELHDREARLSPADAVAIMYTSGTTGQPKGVVLNHRGLIRKSMHATERQGIGAADRLCLFFPLFHMFGNTCIALAGLLRGAALVMPCRRFDPQKILAAVPAERCTAVYGSPSMIIALLDHAQFKRRDWTLVKKGIIGGAPCPMELMRRIVMDVGVSGITVAWGITEASSWITMTLPEDPIERRAGTIGRPLACCEVKIIDPHSGETLPPLSQGELCTRGFLMTEYFNMPAATAAAVDRDGWFHTGDLGEMDAEGYLKITGRLKDVILRAGCEIQPVDVEEVIYRLPEVSEVQVFGFPDPQKGQEAAAWIKLREDARIPIEAVAAHVAEHLPAALCPGRYKFVAGFPMTGSGKIQKYKLAEMAQKEYGRDPGQTHPDPTPRAEPAGRA